MRIKLLQDIVQGGGLKVSRRPGRRTVCYVEGAVVDVSDATGAKYIEQGLAEPFTDEVEGYIDGEQVTDSASEEAPA